MFNWIEIWKSEDRATEMSYYDAVRSVDANGDLPAETEADGQPIDDPGKFAIELGRLLGFTADQAEQHVKAVLEHRHLTAIGTPDAQQQLAALVQKFPKLFTVPE